MRVFISGATGFIGSWVADCLLKAGHELVALFRDANRLVPMRQWEGVSWVEGVLTDFDVIERAMRGCQACVHVALGWGETPLDMLDADTRPTAFLLETAQKLGLERFVYTSSTAALGPFFDGMDESHPLYPDTLYGVTKAASEAYVLGVGARSRLRCNVIRPGYTFGNPVSVGAPAQPDQRFRQLALKASRGEPIEVRPGDGTQFIWSGDLARLYRAVLESDRNREVYFGLARPFTTWQAIAETTISQVAALRGSGSNSGARSPVLLKGEPQPTALFRLDKIQRHFGLSFDSEPHLNQHIAYWVGEANA